MYVSSVLSLTSSLLSAPKKPCPGALMPRAVMSPARPSASSGIPIKAVRDLQRDLLRDLDPKLLMTSKVPPSSPLALPPPSTLLPPPYTSRRTPLPLYPDACYVSSSVRAQSYTGIILRWSPATRCKVSLSVCFVRSVDMALVCRPRRGPAACVLCSSTISTRLPSATLTGGGQSISETRRYCKNFLHFELLMHRSPWSLR